MALTHEDLLVLARGSPFSHHAHDHPWDRALSRRGFIGVAAGATGALVAAQFLRPVRVLADAGEPKPIPGGVGAHIFLPDRGNEPSTIFDFDGTVALAHITGSGMGSDGGVRHPMAFDNDLRFMTGRFVDVNGVPQQGTFGFY
jgi:hypothetical protein